VRDFARRCTERLAGPTDAAAGVVSSEGSTGALEAGKGAVIAGAGDGIEGACGFWRQAAARGRMGRGGLTQARWSGRGEEWAGSMPERE
jgi:hypothetical protein